MANAEDGFSSDAVQKFLLSNGGRATNVQVVGHFAKYLNDPEWRVLNRQKFKDYINEVATVKTEKGEKYLVLKNEYFYKEWIEPKHVVIRSAASQQQTKPSWPPPAPDPPAESTTEQPVPPARKKGKRKSGEQLPSNQNGTSSETNHPRPTISPPIYTGPVEQESVVSTEEGERIIVEHSQIEGVKTATEIFEQETKVVAEPTPSPSRPALVEINKPGESPSVKSAAQMFEKEAQKENTVPKPGDDGTPILSKKKPTDGSPKHHHDDEEHTFTGSLEPLEHQWMMESAKGNIPALMSLLEQEPALVSKKDFITGFSALHWGAKHGKKEMIRLVADRGIDVNIKSQGGYTPLHVAAMHNKEAIMQFLISEYNADINRRDFSGRKPRHYLQTSASNYIKQMLSGQSTAEVIQPRNLLSLAEPQPEKRHSKIGSILRSSFRHSFRLWGSAENLEDKDHKRDRTPPVTPPPSPKSRPKSAHNVTYSKSLLMPPPSGYTVPNRSRKLRSTSDKNGARPDLKKSESDPDLLMETTPATYV